MPMASYRTTPGTSVVTYGIHNPDTLAQVTAPVAAVVGAVTADLRHFHTVGNVTGPAIVRWYEDGLHVVDDYVPPVQNVLDLMEATVVVNTFDKTITHKHKDTGAVILSKTYDDTGTVQGVS